MAVSKGKSPVQTRDSNKLRKPASLRSAWKIILKNERNGKKCVFNRNAPAGTQPMPILCQYDPVQSGTDILVHWRQVFVVPFWRVLPASMVHNRSLTKVEKRFAPHLGLFGNSCIG